MFIVIVWELMDESAIISGLVTKGPNPVPRTIETVHSYRVSQVYSWPDLSRKLDDFRDFSVLGGCCVTAVGDIQLGDIFHDDVFRIHIHETVAAVDAGTIDQGG
jgi:hypothetical protein